MPNHVCNVITAPLEVLQALIRQRTPEELEKDNANRDQMLANIRSRGSDYIPEEIDPEEWFVDFELLVPCDKTKVFQGGCDHQHPHPKEDGSGYYEDCWYPWNVAHWGTKWNAYSMEFLGERTLKFETAWSHPYPILEALSRKFPEATIDVKYADEDRGANCAHYTIKAGQRTPADDDPIEGTEEATRFAVELWGESWEDYQAEMAEYARQEAEYEAGQKVTTAEVRDGLL